MSVKGRPEREYPSAQYEGGPIGDTADGTAKQQAMTDVQQAPAGPTPYELLGGDAAVRALVDRFYDLMDLDPQYAHLRSLHPERLDGSRDKLYMFLSGWLGGPSLYVEKHGHPMLRARHLPFAIATKERDDWLACMRQAMDDTGVHHDLKAALMQAFFGTADWMRNRAD